MSLYYSDPSVRLYNSDCRSMAELPDEYIQMVVTSPPYWGLRKYAGLPDLVWGGKEDCQHDFSLPTAAIQGNNSMVRGKDETDSGNFAIPKFKDTDMKQRKEVVGAFCSLCGAWKGQLGLEPIPELYIAHLVAIFREVRRVLRKGGVCFVNCGDSYFGGGNNRGNNSSISDKQASNVGAVGQCAEHQKNVGKHSVLKPKDLCLIPFRLAIALQEPYQEFTIKELADRAWLAGIIDGEGCIGIHHFERDDRGNHYHSFQPFISVGSIDIPLIERIVRITGMNGTRQTTEPGDTDGRGIISRHANYEWRVEGSNAIKVIEDVFPNLTIKRKQAQIAYELIKCHLPHAGKGHKVPADITAYKLLLWQMIKDCNQRKAVEVNLPEPTPHIEPGWWVRSVIIWSKNNPMPESVTDRPSESHEYILMLTKSAKYYYDQEAVREPLSPAAIERYKYDTGFHAKGGRGELYGFPQKRGYKSKHGTTFGEQEQFHGQDINSYPGGHNLRSVWEFSTQSYKEAHFATYPEELVKRCVLVATPEVGCCSKCGKPWVRIVKKYIPPRSLGTEKQQGYVEQGNRGKGAEGFNVEWVKYKSENPDIFLGWEAQCKCGLPQSENVGSIVLDPFAGSGTTLAVSKRLGRQAVGYELSEKYCLLAVKRIEAETAPMKLEV